MFYIYIVIGIEIFSSNITVIKTGYELGMDYANFNSVELAFLQLFQVMTESSWNALIYEYKVKFKANLTLVSMYFISFHLIMNLILLSLLKGYKYILRENILRIIQSNVNIFYRNK